MPLTLPNLSDDVLLFVFNFVPNRDLGHVARTCKRFQLLCRDIAHEVHLGSYTYTADMLQNILIARPRVTKLVFIRGLFQSTPMTPTILKLVLQFTKLQELVIDVGDVAKASLLEVVAGAKAKLTHVHTLNVAMLWNDVETCIPFLNLFPNVKSATLAQSTATSSLIRAVHALWPKLEGLALGWNIYADVIPILKEMKCLTSLELCNGNAIDLEEGRSWDAHHDLYPLLASLPRLVTLSLRGTFHVPFKDVLPHSLILEELVLTYCRGATGLACVLERCPALRAFLCSDVCFPREEYTALSPAQRAVLMQYE